MYFKHVKTKANKNIHEFLMIFLFFIFPVISYAQTGSVTRPYYMNGKKCGNNVTLSFVDGKLQSFAIECNYNSDKDSNKTIIYNTISQDKYIVSHLTTFINNLKKAKSKFVEWDSVAKANRIQDFIKNIDVESKSDQPLWIKWKYLYKGEMAYSFEQAHIPGYKSLGDGKLTVKLKFIVQKGTSIIGNAFKFPARVYKGSQEQSLGLGGDYDNFVYIDCTSHLYFIGPDEFQTFIDALDFNTAINTIKEKNDKDSSIDSLFK